MPIHHNVPNDRLLEELRRLEEAGMTVRFVVPELIEHSPGHVYGHVIQYIIIFDEPQSPGDGN